MVGISSACIICLITLNIKSTSSQSLLYGGKNSFEESEDRPPGPSSTFSSSIAEKFPSIFGLGSSLFPSGLSIFKSSQPSFPPPNSPPPLRHTNGNHGPPPMPNSITHPVVSNIVDGNSSSLMYPSSEPYPFEPVVSFPKSEQMNQASIDVNMLMENPSAAALLSNLEEKLRDQFMEQSEMHHEMISTFGNGGTSNQTQPVAEPLIQHQTQTLAPVPVSISTATPSLSPQPQSQSQLAMQQLLDQLQEEGRLSTSSTSAVVNSGDMENSLSPAETHQNYHQLQNYGWGKPYSFAYVVKNKDGNNFNQEETSDGHTVSGQYRVLLPDGRIQTVMYIADPIHGYHAVVTYEGAAKYQESGYKSANEPKSKPLTFSMVKRPKAIAPQSHTNNYYPGVRVQALPVRPRPASGTTSHHHHSTGGHSTRPSTSGRFFSQHYSSVVNSNYDSSYNSNSNSHNPPKASYSRHRPSNRFPHPSHTAFNHHHQPSGHPSFNSNKYTGPPHQENNYRGPGPFKPGGFPMASNIQENPSFHRHPPPFNGHPHGKPHPESLPPRSPPPPPFQPENPQKQQQQQQLVTQEFAQNFFNQGHPLHSMLSSSASASPGDDGHNDRPRQFYSNNVVKNREPQPSQLLPFRLPPGDRDKKELFHAAPLPLPYPLAHGEMKRPSHISFPKPGREQQSGRDFKENNFLSAANSNINNFVNSNHQLQAFPSSISLNSNDSNYQNFHGVQASQQTPPKNWNSFFSNVDTHPMDKSDRKIESSSSASSSSYSILPPPNGLKFEGGNPIIEHINKVRGVSKSPAAGDFMVPLETEIKAMILNPLQQSIIHPHPNPSLNQDHQLKSKMMMTNPSQSNASLGTFGGSKDLEKLFTNLAPLTEHIRRQKFHELMFESLNATTPTTITTTTTTMPRTMATTSEKSFAKSSPIFRPASYENRKVKIAIMRSSTRRPNLITSEQTDPINMQLGEEQSQADLESSLANIQLNKTSSTDEPQTTAGLIVQEILTPSKHPKFRRIAKRIRKKFRRIND